MKNVVMIMSGGVGRRFGANIPKQYLKINGKAVIDYVIEKVMKSKKTDKIVIVMDEKYKELSKYLSSSDFIFASNGKERLDSLKNGFDVIAANGGCDKVLICDAVAPMLYPELIDFYFDTLDNYDTVITAQKITGALGNYSYEPLDREDYYITQSPEAFHFDYLMKYFKTDAKSQELAWQLPSTTKHFLNFNFKNNTKLTYNFELEYMKFKLEEEEKQNKSGFTVVNDSSYFKTNGIKDYLLRIEEKKTEEWLENVYLEYKELENKYGPLKNVSLNQSSRYGIVMNVENDENSFIAKMIPSFLNRYEREKDAYIKLSNKYMCNLLGYDDNNKVLFLKKIEDAKPACFEDNIDLTKFFSLVFNQMSEFDYKDENKTFYYDLKLKCNDNRTLLYYNYEIKNMLNYSKFLYDKYFKDSKLKLIHGDLRMDNILKEDDKYYAIDPIGYGAPAVFETCRFIIDDIDQNKNFSMENRLDMLVNYFSKWFKNEDILTSLYIFNAFIAYNSTFENTNDFQTKTYVDLAHVLENKFLDIASIDEKSKRI